MKKPAPIETHFSGKVSRGVMRGADLVHHYMPRLHHLLKFKPFEGTLDILIDRRINIREYATMRIEHVLMDGRPLTQAYLAPVKLVVKKDGVEHECWALRQEKDVYKDDMLEIVDREKLSDKLGLKMGDELEVVMYRLPRKRGVRLLEKIKYASKKRAKR